MDFINKHRVLLAVLGVIALFFILILIAASIKSSNEKKALAEKQRIEAEIASQEAALEQARLEEEQRRLEEEQTKEESDYQANLGVGNDSSSKTQIEIKEDESGEPTVEFTPPEPNIELLVEVYDSTKVPKNTMDGKSFKGYFNSVKLSDFGTNWGTELTNADILSEEKILVGVSQNKDNTEIGDLQSTGWLIKNFDSISDDTAIRFTNLHVLGSLSDKKVALLCVYDWYSAFGMTDTLVMFEDYSGTLDVNDFKDGDIFEATVFKRNMKLVDVNGRRVICAAYNTYSDWVR